MSQQSYIPTKQSYSHYPTVLEWDMSVNHDSFALSKGNRMATQKAKQRTIRTPFIKKGTGRYIVNIKVHKLGHVGVGILNKTFKISAGHLGQSTNSYGTWVSQPKHSLDIILSSCLT